MAHRCWWFGINNADKPKPHSHIVYAQIQPLFSGTQEEFEWPYHKQAKKCYQLMRSNDKVVFWMGDGGPYARWGILGVGFISAIRGVDLNSQRYVLKMEYVPAEPLTPYPSKQCQETEVTSFLKDVFGLSFRPLGKTFNNLGYGTTRPIITIEEIRIDQYEAILQRLQKSPNTLKIHESETLLPEEIPEDVLAIYEGATRRITVNAYERNPEARRKCITRYGVSCTICGFNFYEHYGEIGRDFIHVHHLRQLSEIGQEYQIDPIQDLRPVCPNCHAMLHKRTPPYSIEEIQQFVQMKSSRRNGG